MGKNCCMGKNDGVRGQGLYEPQFHRGGKMIYNQEVCCACPRYDLCKELVADCMVSDDVDITVDFDTEPVVLKGCGKVLEE